MVKRMLIILVICFSLNVFALPQTADSTAAVAKNNVSDIEDFWAMVKLGGGIGFVILGVLALSTFLILFKAINLFYDKRNSKKLLRTSFAELELSEINTVVDNTGESILGRTVNHLVEFMRAGGKAESMHLELMVVMDQENEKFETFRNWLFFFSDSAGALGLLGTVWGVFQTFFGGSLDSEKILNGMGIALITTLLGLAVSLIINFFNTQIHSNFQKYLELVTEKTDELRLRFLRMEHPTRRDAAQKTAAPEREELKKITAEIETPPSIDVFKVRSKEIQAGELKKDMIHLQVMDGGGKPVSGARLIVIAEGPVAFDSDYNQKLICKTNNQGIVNVNLVGGKKVGLARIAALLEGQEGNKKSVEIEVKAGAPAKLAIVSGNDQVGMVGKKLPEAFKLIVTDRFGNPVPNTPLLFKLMMGKGNFIGGNHQLFLNSDTKGLAEAHFILGEETGFHTVRVSPKENEKETVEFRILSKSQ